MLLEGVRSGRGMEIDSKEWKKFWEDYMHVFKRNKDTYMRKAFLHRKAKEDAREIALYIAEDNPEAADAFRVALERIREVLADLPEIGSIRSFNNKELFRFDLTYYFFCFSNSF
jgi:plasmid stabilization system protein ParE